MEITRTEKKTYEVSYIKLEVFPRYWEDATVNGVEDTEGTLIPLRRGDIWSPIINVDTGIIEDWPEGTTANIHYKVCDAGSYIFLDGNLNKLITIEDSYVVDMGTDSGGDYVIMDVNKDGLIANWYLNYEEDDY